MTQHRTVNQTLDQLEELHGQPVEIEGILGIKPEGYELLHYPKAERRPDNGNEGPIHESSLWLAFGSGSIKPNPSVLSRWEGKRVRIHGVVYSAKSLPVVKGFEGHGGFGPWGFWRAQVEPYSIQRVTSEQRKE
jgi:hypothetical protein